MKTIWKFLLLAENIQYIIMPEDAEILTVQVQNGDPYIWVLVDPEKQNKEREIIAIGTGHIAGDGFGGKYIGTFQLLNGNLVFHIFDKGYKS